MKLDKRGSAINQKSSRRFSKLSGGADYWLDQFSDLGGARDNIINIGIAEEISLKLEKTFSEISSSKKSESLELIPLTL